MTARPLPEPRAITREDILDHVRFIQNPATPVVLIEDWRNDNPPDQPPPRGPNPCPECGYINATLRVLSQYMGGKPCRWTKEPAAAAALP